MEPAHDPARARHDLAAVLAVGLATTAALTLARPHLAGGPLAWNGDDLALDACWWAALAGSVWLTVTTAACLALGRRHARAAHRIARWAPPIARRLLQAALVGTTALGLPAAAYAAPATPGGGSAAPIVVYVGAGGRLTAGPDGGASKQRGPVVRTPATSPPPPTSSPRRSPRRSPRASTPTTQTPTTTPPTTRPASIAGTPAPAPRGRGPRIPAPPTPAAARPHTYVVRPGDNLWRIAAAELSRVRGGRADDEQVAPYWRRLIETNRAALRSGDPSLIFPGEVVTLPPL